MVLQQRLLDTSHLVETPEGIELQAELAGLLPRVLAYLIDLAIRGIVLFIAGILLSLAGKIGSGLMLLLMFALEWGYPVLFEMLSDGQTPGKKQLGIATVSEDLSPLGWSSSLLRNLLRTADFLPLGYALGVVCMCCSTRFQRLGDIAAGTIVIHRSAQARHSDLPEGTGAAPTMPLSLPDQLAVVAFAQRHRQLSGERQQELANILAPALGVHDDAAVKRLRGMARWLMGER